MATRKRTVEVEVVVDDKRARQNLQNIEGSTRKTAKGFSDMGKLVRLGLASFGAREMVQALKRMDELNQQMQANEQRADTVFASMSDDAREWADDQNEAFGLGENALLGLASNMQDLLVPMGFAREEAFSLTKETLLLANALDDWKGGTLGVDNATQRIIKSMLGEREGLVELGIKISEADVKNRLLQKGQEDLTGELLQQAKAQATLELITEKSSDAVAAYTDRTGGAIAVQKELNASMADTQETWATLLKPTLEEAKGLFGDVTTVMAGVSGQMADASGEGFNFIEFVEKAFPPTLLLTNGVEALAGLFRDEADASGEAAAAASKLTEAEKRVREELRMVASATDAATESTKNLAEEQLAAADPAFALLKANESFVTAQRKYNEAVAEFGADSAQARSAQAELLETAGKLNATQQQFATEFGPEGEEALRQLAVSAGIYGDDLDRVLRFIRAIARDTKMIPPIPGSGGGGASGPFHEGGTVPGTPGSDQLIMAQAGEEITRRSEVNGHQPTVERELRDINVNMNVSGAGMNTGELSRLLGSELAWKLKTLGV